MGGYVGSLKLQVSFAEYSLFYRALLQKRPIIIRSLLIVATPYQAHLLSVRVAVGDKIQGSFDEIQGFLDRIQGSFDRKQGFLDRIQGSFDRKCTELPLCKPVWLFPLFQSYRAFLMHVCLHEYKHMYVCIYISGVYMYI